MARRTEIPVRIALDAEGRAAVSELGKVEAAAKQADDAVDTLDGSDVRIDTSRAESNLEDVERKARDADDSVDRVGEGADTLQSGIGPLRGFTDELGAAAGAGGVAANAFIDAGEAVQIFGQKAGLSQRALGRVAGAISGVGIAVGAGVAAWNAYREAQDRAAERAENMIEVQRELAEGNYREAAQNLVDTWDSLFAQAADRGFTVAEIMEEINGSGTIFGETVATWTERLEDSGYTDRMAILALEVEKARGELETSEGALRDSEKAVDDVTVALGGTLEEAEKIPGAVDDITDAAGEAETRVGDMARAFDTFDRKLSQAESVLRLEQQFADLEAAAREAYAKADEGGEDAEQANRDLQLEILRTQEKTADYLGTLEEIPEEKVTEILNQINATSYLDAQNAIAELTKDQEVVVRFRVENRGLVNSVVIGPGSRSRSATATGNTREAAGVLATQPVAAAGITNLTVNVSRTSDMRDVSRTLDRWARVNGRPWRSFR